MVRRAAPLVLAISLGGRSLLTLGEGEYSGGSRGEPGNGFVGSVDELAI